MSDLDADVALFEGYEPEPQPTVEPLSADRRRTLRQSEDIAAGRHPLTGGRLHELASRHRDASAPASDPFTCGSCWFREVMPTYRGKTYPKCVFGAQNPVDGRQYLSPADLLPRASHGAATDVRAWWPACPDYSPSDRLSNDAARSIPAPTEGASR